MDSLPFRYALEIFIIFLPLIYHAVYGVYIAFTAKNNAGQYSYMRNWLFVLQRVISIITLILSAGTCGNPHCRTNGRWGQFRHDGEYFELSYYAWFLHCRCFINNFPLLERFMVFRCYLGHHGNASFSKNFDIRYADYFCCTVICRLKSDFCICLLDY